MNSCRFGYILCVLGKRPGYINNLPNSLSQTIGSQLHIQTHTFTCNTIPNYLLVAWRSMVFILHLTRKAIFSISNVKRFFSRYAFAYFGHIRFELGSKSIGSIFGEQPTIYYSLALHSQNAKSCSHT